MKRKQSAQLILRFRYWSRKAYAAFASIGRCVTIGCLRKGVVDSSLSKQKTGVTSTITKTIIKRAEHGKYGGFTPLIHPHLTRVLYLYNNNDNRRN